jgi:prepilin-type processing-associated H-X9-DG protein
MAIVFQCECGKYFETRDEDAGRRARCPSCQRELIVPQPKPLPEGDFAPLQELGTARTSGKAITSFVLGLCVPLTCALTGLPAILFGILGLIDVNNPKKRLRGQGFAITGIVLGGMSVLVIPVMLALLLPAVQAAREAARRAQCTNNLKQISLAIHNFESANGKFPPAAKCDANGKPLLSWRVLILPYMDSSGLYEQFHLDEPWDSPHNKPLSDQIPNAYQCPSSMAPPGQTTYEVVVDPSSIFTGEPVGVDLKSVTDGTTNTLMIAEATNPVPWSKPEDLSLAVGDSIPGIGSKHPGGFNAAMVDGSIRFIKNSPGNPLPPSELKALVTRDGGERVSPP